MHSATTTGRAILIDEGIDRGAVWHFGDPHHEQRALERGNAAVDTSLREVLEVTGPDRHTWLHSLTTAWLLDLAPGDSAEALILDPKGHVEHDLRIVETGDGCIISVEPGMGAALKTHLDSMRFLLRVEVVDRTSELATAWWTPPEPPPQAVAVWRQPGEFSGAGTTPAGQDRGGDASRYVGARPASLPGCEIVVPRHSLADALAGTGSAGMWALEALRVAAAVPRLGLETDHRTLPHEVGWIGPAVHLAKGCYRGQEAVARVHNLGRPPRRLALAHLDGSAERLPGHGDPVSIDGTVVGWVGTAARHHELGPVATVIVKRSVALDGQFDIDGIPAGQEPVVVV